MEDKYSFTFVINATKIDEYQRGFISGIMYFLTGKPSRTSRWARVSNNTEDSDRWIKDLDCTLKQAEEIRDEIVKHFPDVTIEIS